MQRRAFIRLAGGGIVLAAAGGWLAAGRAAAVPASATAAWQAAAAETELRRYALAHALLAPNPHNLQPWLADLSRPNEIWLSLDPERALPATDPYSRQIMMGAGAFLELLSIAAAEQGRQAEITLFPEGVPAGSPDSKPFARVRFERARLPARDALYKAIPYRRTERGAYDPARPLGAAPLAALEDAVKGMQVGFGVAGKEGGDADDRMRAEAIRRIVREAWRVETGTAATFMESMRLMRVGGAEIDRHRDGIAMPSAVFVAMDKLGMFDRTRFPGADSMAIQSQLKRFDSLTASTPSYLWLTTPTNSRAAQIEAGRAYARLNLAGTTVQLAMHPNEQALQEYPEMAPHYAAIHALLAKDSPGATVQMLARVGYLPPDVLPSEPAPRRGLEAHLRG